MALHFITPSYDPPFHYAILWPSISLRGRPMALHFITRPSYGSPFHYAVLWPSISLRGYPMALHFITPSYGPPFHYAILWPSISLHRPMALHFIRSCIVVFCQVFFFSLHQLSTHLHTIGITISFHMPMAPCHLNLHLLITSPIASTPSLLRSSSVLVCLSLREALHIHVIIVISVLSISTTALL